MSIAEDELVSLDDLQEKVAEFEDYVQSSDIAAMQSTFPLFFLAVMVVLMLVLQNCKRYPHFAVSLV